MDPAFELEVVDADLASSDATEAWGRILAAVRPVAMLVAIRLRMGEQLCSELDPEDIWQETLLHAWRDRSRFEWMGLKAFRRWLLQIAEHRICNTVDRMRARSRAGADAAAARTGEGSGSSADDRPPEPIASTTPSRVLLHRELAEAMHRVLQELPQELRDVVRLRLFEDQTTEEVAASLGIGTSAVKHRLRKGVAIYRRRLEALLGGSRPPPEDQNP